MAGHSHWAGIKHKKALIDNKRGKLWSKLCKAIMVAAKIGGKDVDTNLRLRYAIDAAKAVSVPKDNIERAIKKGAGELGAETYEDVVYEGYGPFGVAVLLQVLTDNRNRTAGELRKIFEIGGGKMGTTGCVAYLFDRKGLALVPAAGVSEDRLMEVALEAGADDIRKSGENFEVVAEPAAFQGVLEALQQAGITPESTDIGFLPNNTVDLDAEAGRAVLALLEKLDDHDDVQQVTANFNLSEQALAEIDQQG